MKWRLADLKLDAEGLLPPAKPDGSGIGVNYIDATLKPFNTSLEDGRAVTCKRKGLKIMLGVGDEKAEAIIDRIHDGPDPRDMLWKALDRAGSELKLRFVRDESSVYLESADAVSQGG